jgi:hypothetical protein
VTLKGAVRFTVITHRNLFLKSGISRIAVGLFKERARKIDKNFYHDKKPSHELLSRIGTI